MRPEPEMRREFALRKKVAATGNLLYARWAFEIRLNRNPGPDTIRIRDTPNRPDSQPCDCGGTTPAFFRM